ncbi:MAG: HAMP domain-containing sensor histidine kinase [Chryseolinea sp.]
MRLLQVNLRTLLLCLLVLVVVSIPVSFFAIRQILYEEADESLANRSDQFIKHIKTFEYLDDLEMDIGIWDQLSNDITITPTSDLSIQRHFNNLALFDSVEHELKPYRILSTPVEIKSKHYLLVVRMSLVDNDDLVIVLALVQVIILLLLAGIMLIVSRRLNEQLWRPFYHTLNQLKAYELDKSESIQPSNTKIVEFDDLNKTVTHLTNRNRKVFLQQKEFIENASHELQTPLAVFQSKLDVLMQNTSLDEDAAATILELEEATHRMMRLNRNLLLLSKIDNDQFTDSSDVDVSKAAERILNNLSSFAEVGGITINTNLKPVTVKANPTLIEVLLNNLFHNAIRYTSVHGAVDVVLSNSILKVANVGEALKMSTDKLFDRFSKESVSGNSTGLGLAIVKRICDFYGYEVRYKYVDGRHEFDVNFTR